MVYIRQEQAKHPKHHKLNVFQLMVIYNVCFGDGLDMSSKTIDQLVSEGILLRSRNGKLSMSKVYWKIVSEISASKRNDGINDGINDGVNDGINDGINDSVKATYLVIGANPGIQRKRIAELAGKSVPAIERHIAILIKEQLVEHRGSNKTGGYYAKENKKE